MSRFEIEATPLAGLQVVRRLPRGDARGSLTRLFCSDELAAAGWHGPVAQVNHTVTVARGTVRGLHFQHPPHAETKLVSCLRGEVWDVAVDLRAGSPTLLRWFAERLSADNHRALLIPPGFAHGFQTLTDNVEMLYLHSAAYAPDAEDGLNPLDPRLAIAWPQPPLHLSPRDTAHAFVETGWAGIATEAP